MLDAARQRARVGQPEPARELGRRQPARQLEQRERVAARLGEDPVAHALVEPARARPSRAARGRRRRRALRHAAPAGRRARRPSLGLADARTRSRSARPAGGGRRRRAPARRRDRATARRRRGTRAAAPRRPRPAGSGRASATRKRSGGGAVLQPERRPAARPAAGRAARAARRAAARTADAGPRTRAPSRTARRRPVRRGSPSPSLGDVLQQCGLADPRLAAQHQHRALARSADALQQRGPARRSIVRRRPRSTFRRGSTISHAGWAAVASRRATGRTTEGPLTSAGLAADVPGRVTGSKLAACQTTTLHGRCREADAVSFVDRARGCSASPGACSAMRPTPMTWCRTRGCAGRRPTAARCAIRSRSSSRPRRGSRSTSGSPPARAMRSPSARWIARHRRPGADPSRGAEQARGARARAATLLEKLSPTERAVYVLREAFDYPAPADRRGRRAQRGQRPADRRRARRRLIAAAPRWAPTRPSTAAARRVRGRRAERRPRRARGPAHGRSGRVPGGGLGVR